MEDRSPGRPRLSGRLKIAVVPASLAFGIYQGPEMEEEFNCSYELNPAYRDRLEAGGLTIAGVGENGEARIVEMVGHPFYLATAFLPQFSSRDGRPHALITAYLEAAGRN